MTDSKTDLTTDPVTDLKSDSIKKYCGYAAIVGRPNVGKSTLLNHLLGQKLSITSRKPQTTRHNMLGIKTVDDYQIIFVDTPGIHQADDKAINRYMNRSAEGAIRDVDVIVFVVDRDRWTQADEVVAQQIRRTSSPVIIAINKVDRIDDRDTLLPHINRLTELLPEAQCVPVSALRSTNLEVLEAAIKDYLQPNDFYFSEDQITDKSQRFLAAELIREKITRQLGEELPYQATVEIEEFKVKGQVCHISALILVERDGQKKIIIGEKGQRIKHIGTQARQDIERMLESKVMLTLWVKVKSGWSDDERALRSLGYRDGV